MKTYSLAEVAHILCGDDMKDPELWVTRRLLSGLFAGYKAGRQWRMTEQQLADALEVLSQPRSSFSGLSAGSARRRLVVAQ